MRHLNGVYTQRINRAHQRDGPLFREGYKAIFVEAESFSVGDSRHSSRSVPAKLTTLPDLYRWSNHAWYLKPTSALVVARESSVRRLWHAKGLS